MTPERYLDRGTGTWSATAGPLITARYFHTETIEYHLHKIWVAEIGRVAQQP